MVLTLLLAAAPAAADAATAVSKQLGTVRTDGHGGYMFEQRGFGQTGAMAGWFSGADRDGNRQLSLRAGELTAFTASFSGAGVRPFTVTLADLQAFAYDLDGTIGDGLVLDIEGISAMSGTSGAFYLSGATALRPCDGIGICGFVSDGFVDEVPEPSVLAMLAAPGLALGWRRLRARKSSAS